MIVALLILVPLAILGLVKFALVLADRSRPWYAQRAPAARVMLSKQRDQRADLRRVLREMRRTR